MSTERGSQGSVDRKIEPQEVFRVERSSWQWMGLQAIVFRIARWLFFSPFLATPFVFFLESISGDLAAVALRGFFYVVMVAVALALFGLVLEANWVLSGGEVKLKGKRFLYKNKRKETSFSQKELRSGWVNGASLELETQHGNVLSLQMHSLGDAAKLLKALGLDAQKRIFQMVLGVSDFPTVFMYLVLPVPSYWIADLGRNFLLKWVEYGDPIISIIMMYLWIFSFFVLRGVARAFFLPARLTIGADGVRIEQNFKNTFLPFSMIESWNVNPDGVRFFLRDRREVHARGRHLGMDGKDTAVNMRLYQARRVFLEGGGSKEVRLRLARGEQSISAWRESLQRLSQHDDYRQAAVSDEDLLTVLESAEETAETRIGAAIALRTRAPEVLQKRLRVAAKTSANPRLEGVLRSLASDEEDDQLLLTTIEEDRRVRKIE